MRILSILFSLFMGLALSQPVWAYKEADLQRLLKSNSDKCTFAFGKPINRCCQRCDLSGANLTGANLHGANLDLDGFNLARANLEGTIFCKTIMLDGTINNSDC